MYENRISNPKARGFYLPKPQDSKIVFISRGFDRIDSPNISDDTTIEELKKMFWVRGKNVFSKPRKKYSQNITTTDFIDEAKKDLSFLINNGFDEINVLGISYGGLIAMNLGLEFDDEIKKIFLRAPLTDLPGMVKGKYNHLMSEATRTYFQGVRDTYLEFMEDGKNQEIYTRLSDFKIPLFSLHSRDDKMMPSIQTRDLIQKLRQYGHKEANFKLMEKRRHECNPKGNCSIQFNMVFDFFYGKKLSYLE